MKLSMEEHGDVIREHLEAGASYRQIAKALGCNKETVGLFVKVNFPDLRRRPHQATPLPEQPSEAELLRAELDAARKVAKKVRSADVQAELLLQEVRSQVTPAEVRYEAPEVAEGSGKNHMQVLLLSDFHVGEVVDPEAVNGLNSYNWEIFTERMASIQEALISFQNNRPYPIDEIVIVCLGDNCSGNHHQELAVTNEFPIAEQCYRAGVFLGKWIEPLAQDYPKIRVVGVEGNHSRVSQKPAAKQVFDNFDWLGYMYAEQYLSKYPNIETFFPRSSYAVIDVCGKNMLAWHGDGIRSTMPGVPWGGVMRRTNELKKQYAEQGVLLSYFALGHFHQANVVQGSVFMNGSVKGLDEYSLKQFGSGEKPTQLLLTFCRDKQRLTDVSFITP